MDLYYINEQHRKNHQEITMRFSHMKENREYVSASYICAIPELFNQTSIEEMEHGPLEWLLDALIEEGESGESIRLYQLRRSQGEYLMAILGVMLWNGSHKDKFNLNNALFTWTPEYFRAFQQVIKIYRGRE